MDKSFYSCTASFPKLLHQLNSSLVLSAYQLGKLIFISSRDGEKLDFFAKSFKRPMGIALDGRKLGVAGKFEVDVFANAPELVQSFPQKTNNYDGLFIPKLSYYTAYLDIHEIAWGSEGLWAVNTSFSCLSLMNDAYSFIPK